jgi:hypothetical protein
MNTNYIIRRTHRWLGVLIGVQFLAWTAVTFDDTRHSTAYVATETGALQKMRNTPWRRFDFLWMLHTMDYQGRDNIGNWVLRVFSVFGLLTVLSVFLLFFVSSKHKV